MTDQRTGTSAPHGRTCLTCQWHAAGECHRYPPQMVLWPNDNQHPIMYMPSASWPDTGPDNFCGEWRSIHG